VTAPLSKSFLSQGNIVSPLLLAISVINSGRRPITLNGVGFLLPSGGKKPMMEIQSDIRFPYTLTETNPQCNVWKVQKQFAIELRRNGFKGKVKVRGYYQSAMVEISKSEKFSFSIEDFTK
jgi:hypothetical protein